MRTARFFLIVLLISLGVTFVAEQDNPPGSEVDENLIPMPPTSTPILDEDLIPLPPNLPTLAPDSSRITPGYWRKTRSATTITGTCAAMGIAHNPDGGGGSAPTPVIPTVPIFQSNAGDFLIIDGYAYAKLQPQIYGTSDSNRQLGMTLSGATTAVKTFSSIEYQIVSPSLIAIHDTYSEEGGCTVASDSKYELVKTDSTIAVTTVDDIVYPQPTSTPVPADGTPVAPVQPIPPGTYPVTWTVDSGTCTDKTQPTFTEAKVDYANNGDMLLRLGDDTHTLFALGDDSYTRYQLVSSKNQINVQVVGGVIKMDWGKFAGMSMCFKSGELAAAAEPPATTVSPIMPTATPIAAAGNQHYQISFQPDVNTCPKSVQDKLPSFNGAAIEALPNGDYQLVAGDVTYSFTNKSGYTIYDGSNPSKGLTYQIMLNVMQGQGGQLALTYMTASGEFCLAQMSLSPQ